MKKDYLQISVISDMLLLDYDFAVVLSLVCKNLGEARFIECTRTYSVLPNLHCSFSSKPLAFLRNTNVNENEIQSGLLSETQGVIINLAGPALDINYLDQEHTKDILMRYLKVVYQAKQPTVFAIQDMKGIPVSYPTIIYREDIPKITNEELKRRERETPPFHQQDDIWQPNPPTFQAIREILQVPIPIPLFPYSHTKPESIEHLLKTLLAMIET